MIYVATSSPRRIELLNKFCFDYEQVEPCDEKINLNSLENLAVQKALAHLYHFLTKIIQKQAFLVTKPYLDRV